MIFFKHEGKRGGLNDQDHSFARFWSLTSFIHTAIFATNQTVMKFALALMTFVLLIAACGGGSSKSTDKDANP